MVSRLVLGCGETGRAVAGALVDAPGKLTVIDPDGDRVQRLREDGIRAEIADPSDPGVLDGRDPDVAFVAFREPEANLAAASVARRAYPEGHLVVFLGTGATADVRSAIAEVADEIVDPGMVLAETVLDAVGSPAGARARMLRRTLQTIDGKLAIVTHDNPDPDAIASAVALGTIAEAFGIEAAVCYFGSISHQENRALVNLLDLELRNLDPDADLSAFDGFALVDHSLPGVNDQLPEDLEVDVVIDHHPPRAPVGGTYVDLRQDVGSTSTLLVEYLDQLGIGFDEQVATALLYGIRVDTDDFFREVSTADFEAAARLVEIADHDALARVENPSIGSETMSVLARAIENREVQGSVLATFVGEIRDRDALAQAADMLLNMNGISATMVVGYVETTAYVSARARGTDLDLGEAMRVAFGQIGSAGGHAEMAGAQIPLKSIVVLAEEDEDPDEVIAESIHRRFFETIEDVPIELAEYPLDAPDRSRFVSEADPDPDESGARKPADSESSGKADSPENSASGDESGSNRPEP